ncbi:hypothetical protein [Sphaerisporangium perillae]|uniref:hypothetical protein n=1 Tax=Sphaerisporangium perillae TaxID=2935860 RepID=UPI00200C39D1|nr:hypothetical protein [Sphaerisporangium perillae]
MADGTRKLIKDVRVGDEVIATDPETGVQRAEPVTFLIEGTARSASFAEGMSPTQIEWAIRRACKGAEIVGRNKDGVRVLLGGVYKGREIFIESP